MQGQLFRMHVEDSSDIEVKENHSIHSNLCESDSLLILWCLMIATESYPYHQTSSEAVYSSSCHNCTSIRTTSLCWEQGAWVNLSSLLINCAPAPPQVAQSRKTAVGRGRGKPRDLTVSLTSRIFVCVQKDLGQPKQWKRENVNMNAVNIQSFFGESWKKRRFCVGNDWQVGVFRSYHTTENIEGESVPDVHPNKKPGKNICQVIFRLTFS